MIAIDGNPMLCLINLTVAAGRQADRGRRVHNRLHVMGATAPGPVHSFMSST